MITAQTSMSAVLSIALRMGAVGLVALTSCADPTHFDATAQDVPQAPGAPEDCAASREWLPQTPPLALFNPLPHPETECPFYRGGWQNFLIATQPDATGEPAIKSYPTIDDVFQSATPHAPRGTPGRAWLGDIKQAGGRQILIDQNGHTLYYGIHVNQAYADFIRENHLETAKAIQNAPPRLFFPAGVVEFKSAWQWIAENDPSKDEFITTQAYVPHLHQDPTTKAIVEDKDHPELITVRLLALHVVYTLPGHPEFIWATFEHSKGEPDTMAADGQRDVAPIHPGGVNPSVTDPNNQLDTTVVSDQDHVLYKAGTTAQAGNQAIEEGPGLTFNEATQSFPGAQTSIYRMFPASKSNTVDPDEAITSLNHNVEALFDLNKDQLAPTDKRSHYRLVGAQWLDKPRFFDTNKAFQNDLTNPFVDQVGKDAFVKDIKENGSDSDLSILAGEDRLSSTSMESFTQAPDSFNNCFTCHNTQAITAKGIPLNRDVSGVKLLDPKQLNVSHVLSQFVLEECNVPANFVFTTDASGASITSAVCP